MTLRRSLHDWLIAKPLAADALLALLLTGPSMAIPPELTTNTPTPQSVSIALAACAALVVRRRWPVPVWAVTVALAAVGTYLMQGPSGLALPALVALYTVATSTSQGRALGFAAASAGILFLAQAVAGATTWRDPAIYMLPTWCFLASIVGVAVRDQRRIVAAAQERARAAEESREEEAQRRVADERLRIARELHDVVAHHIAVIQVQAGVAEHLLASNPEVAHDAIVQVRESSREVLGEMATLLGVLRPADPDARREPVRGLGRLDELVDSFRSTGLRVTIRRDGAPTPLAPLVDVTAYRVIEESLTNAFRHGSGSAEVTVASAPGAVVIDVTNPVPGMARASGPVRAASHGAGLGLRGMRERVDAVGGTLNTGTHGTGRFTVHVELPTRAAGAPPSTAPAYSVPEAAPA